MKNRLQQYIVCLLVLICFAVIPSSIFASDINAKQADLTVSVLFEEADGRETKKTPLSGADILLYKVASLVSEENSSRYVLESAFKDIGVDINNMTAEQSLNAAGKCMDIIKNKSIQALRSEKTDSSGKAVFKELGPGMYLGVQKDAVKIKEQSVFFGPSLWTAPEGNIDASGIVKWDYSVSVYPKVAPKITKETEKPPTPTPPKKTTTKTTGKKGTTGKNNVKTGDENQTQIYIGLAIMSISMLVLLYTIRKKKKKQSDSE